VRRALPAPVAAPSLDEPDDAAATGADAPPPRRPAATTTAKAPAATTTAAAAAKPKPKPAAKPAAPVTTEAPPETTTRAATTTAPPRTTTERAPAPQAPSQFRPSRNWAWPPTPGADYYFVEFFRAGQSLYRARPTEPRLTLPESVVFVPGIYRWRVRPGHGAPSENRLDEPIVDSEFVLPR
jgi:hypothetical protein